MVGGEGNPSLLPNGHQLLDLGWLGLAGCSLGLEPNGHKENPPRLLLVLLDLERDLHLDLRCLDL